MITSDLKAKTIRQSTKIIGRGGKRGKTSGRGTKGQWAHGGHGVRPELRDIIKKYPKLRGRGIHSNKPISVKPVAVNLHTIEDAYNNGEEVSLATLKLKKLIASSVKRAKILGVGTITKKVTIAKEITVSVSAKAGLEKIGIVFA